MKQFIDRAIILTSCCTLGWATIPTAQGVEDLPTSSVVRELQLQRLENSLIKDLQPSVTSMALPVPQPAGEAVALIKEFEGFESRAYIDTDGTPVIGYGLSRVAGKPVRVGDRISPQRADLALNKHLQEIYRELDRIIKVRLSDRQLGALASIAFNVGINALERSTLIEKINDRDYVGAADEFLRWDKANVNDRLVQLPGLTRRRQAERQLFLQ